jgi:hypothetical protein
VGQFEALALRQAQGERKTIESRTPFKPFGLSLSKPRFKLTHYSSGNGVDIAALERGHSSPTPTPTPGANACGDDSSRRKQEETCTVCTEVALPSSEARWCRCGWLRARGRGFRRARWQSARTMRWWRGRCAWTSTRRACAGCRTRRGRTRSSSRRSRGARQRRRTSPPAARRSSAPSATITRRARTMGRTVRTTSTR